MKTRDAMDLVLLAAIWGASFLFMRVAAPAMGPVALMAARVGIGAFCLVPVLAWRRGLPEWRGRLGHLLVVGIVNSALPFCLFAYASLSVTAGLASILNATSPLWGGLVAHLWLKDRLTRERALGLLIGFAGVAVLVWGKASLRPGGGGLAVAAALAATLCYGIAASYTKRFLRGANPLSVAAGSQLGASLVLLPPAVVLWPTSPIPGQAWGAALALGIACTAVAYVLYFRLIASVGPARAIAVTFLIPPFGLAWGALFLGEAITLRTLAGSAVVLAGTALATGLVRMASRRAPAPRGEMAKRPRAPRSYEAVLALTDDTVFRRSLL